MVSYASGWRILSEKYSSTGEVEGRRFRFRAAKFDNLSYYRGVLFITVNEHGLGLSVFFLFRPGHHPLFLPWENFRVVTERGVFTAYRRY